MVQSEHRCKCGTSECDRPPVNGADEEVYDVDTHGTLRHL